MRYQIPDRSAHSLRGRFFASVLCLLFTVAACPMRAEINLLAPATGDRLVAEGFVVKPGRTLVITRGEVHAEKHGKRTLVAIMQQTLIVMHGKKEA